MMCSLYCNVLLNVILYTPVHYKHDKSNDQIGTLPRIHFLNFAITEPESMKRDLFDIFISRRLLPTVTS